MRIIQVFSVSMGLGINSLFAGNNLVQNGSFEAVQLTAAPYNSSDPANIPGWTHTGSQGDALLWANGYNDGGGSVTVAGDGNQFVTMGGGYLQNPALSSWDQVLSGLTPGETYALDFKIASEADYSGAQPVTVSFPTGSATASQTFTAPYSAGHYWQLWQPENMSFVASGASVDLMFSASTSFDVGLDAVSVTAALVPEADAARIFGLGIVVIGLLRRKLVKS